MQSKNYSVLRNSVFNILGWLVPVLVNFLSVPIIVGYLGADGYGVWTLVMSVMGYFALLDLGVMKGGVRFLSEALAKGDREGCSQITSIGLYFYCAIGVIGAVVIIALTDTVLLPLLSIPEAIRTLSRDAFRLASIGFLVTMLQTYMLSLPQAAHRFDMSNIIDSSNQILTILATIAALAAGFGLIAVIVIRIVGGLLCIATTVIVIRRTIPNIGLTSRINVSLARRIFSYSATSFLGRLGTTTATQLQPIVVGSVLGTAAVTAFSIPFLLVSRLMGLSYRLSTVIFPISSELSSEDQTDVLTSIYLKMSRYQTFVNVALLVFLGVFSWQILALWISPKFADESGIVLYLVAIGYFFDATTNLPSQICDGLGHPRLTSIFALIRGGIGILGTLIGAHVSGIVGVSVGYMISSIVLALAFNLFIHPRLLGISYFTVVEKEIPCLLFGFAVAVVALTLLSPSDIGRPSFLAFAVEAAAMCSVFSLFGYAFVLSKDDRMAVRQRVSRYFAKQAQ